MDDPPKAYESMADVLRAIQKHFGPAISEVNKWVAPTAKAQAQADIETSPMYAELEKNLYQKYGPIMAAIGSEIAQQNALASSKTELDVARGPGRELIKEADITQRELDPEFYANRVLLSDAISKYLGSMDPSKLTPAEREEISRAAGSLGYSHPESAADTAAKAMMFGKGLREKQNAFGDAILRVSQAIPTMRSGLTGFEIATRRALGTNLGEARTPGAMTGTGGANTFGFANNFLNQASGLEQAYVRGRTPWYQGVQGISNALGSAGNILGKFKLLG